MKLEHAYGYAGLTNLANNLFYTQVGKTLRGPHQPRKQPILRPGGQNPIPAFFLDETHCPKRGPQEPLLHPESLNPSQR